MNELSLTQPVAASGDRFSISQLAAEFDVTPRALRFYEDQELLAPERRGTTRIYNRADRARLIWILRGRRVGLSIAEIKDLIDLYDIDEDHMVQRRETLRKCKEQLEKLQAQREDIDEAIGELKEFIASVEQTEDDPA